jgi:hypothetical protein
MLKVDSEQNLGRAKNAIQDYLVRKLLYPKIYLDADWNGTHVDVLAIDRTGVGDVHAVRLVLWEPGHSDDHGWSAFLERRVGEAMQQFADFPGQFRYVAVVSIEANKQRWIPGKPSLSQSLAADGVGRIGILYVDVTEQDPSTQLQLLLKPERFRSSKQIMELADQYMAANEANWELRE